MANEIYNSSTLTANKGGVSVSQTASETITMDGDDMVQGTQVIGTSWEAIDWGEITGAPRRVQLKNLDATNFVDLATANDDSGVFGILDANGGTASFRPKVATIYAKADTAACRVSRVAVEA